MATKPVYTTRERVKAAASFTERTDALVDRAIAAASRTIDAECHRRFYPETATRYWDWPDAIGSRSWKLRLDNHELISLTSMTIAGTAATVANFNLEPANDGPPYSTIEADLSTSAAFSAGTTHQRAVAVTGLFGFDNVTEAAGTLAEALDATETEIDVTNGGLVGVGDLLTVGTERMLVTEVAFLDTTVDTDAYVDLQMKDVTIPVADESGFIAGETIRLEAEKMVIDDADTSGNLNVITRAVDGTTLIDHASGTDVYANRRLTVERAATGSTAATHLTSAAITRQVYPSLIEQWCIAEAVVQLSQQTAAYARTAGTGDNERETIGKGLVDIRQRALAAYGRRVRTMAV